ncbi:MAG TPA: carboxypeptidase regulatory-like domain-containing protein [Verrucomicrobiae bacterium]|jgi:plastocyanin|nr:carboxypeptidase regulatory-like domain-containing protein [Verrucomicrobiae bacterium]
MKVSVIVVFIALLGGASAIAGTIVGNVHAQGKAGVDSSGGGQDGAYASRKYKFVPKVDYAAMDDFVVYIEGQVGTNTAESTNILVVSTKRIAQHGAMFSPHVMPVMVGTTVEWPNDDNIYHNVFSMSDAKQFDLGLYKGNPPDKRVRFDKPGRVDVFCSIHENMHCVVLVLENPYFGTTDEKGNFKIPNVPHGTYTLKAWHERLPADEKQIVVPADGTVKADFTLTIKNLPQY